MTAKSKTRDWTNEQAHAGKHPRTDKRAKFWHTDTMGNWWSSKVAIPLTTKQLITLCESTLKDLKRGGHFNDLRRRKTR